MPAHPILAEYGYWALFAVLCAESLGLPLPGETLLVASSFLATRGEMQIVAVAAVAVIAAVLGDNIGYLIGRWGGRRLILRHGARVGIYPDHLARAERFFARFGPEIVVVARFLPVLRQLNGIVAGSAGMSWKRFVVYNILGATLWVGTWTTAVFLLGTQVERWLHRVQGLSAWLAGVCVVLVLAGCAMLLRARRNRKSKRPE